jgi:hypothetical protein
MEDNNEFPCESRSRQFFGHDHCNQCVNWQYNSVHDEIVGCTYCRRQCVVEETLRMKRSGNIRKQFCTRASCKSGCPPRFTKFIQPCKSGIGTRITSEDQQCKSGRATRFTTNINNVNREGTPDLHELQHTFGTKSFSKSSNSRPSKKTLFEFLLPCRVVISLIREIPSRDPKATSTNI